MRSGDGAMSVEIRRRGDRDGLEMPSLDVFRQTMAEVTGEQYPVEGDWVPLQVETPETGWETDANGGDAADVEKYVHDSGQVVKDDLPF